MSHHEGTSEVLFPGLPLTTCHPQSLLHPQHVSHHVVLGINLLWYVLEDFVPVAVVSLVKEQS